MARCGWCHGWRRSGWHPCRARPRPQMVGASMAPRSTNPMSVSAPEPSRDSGFALAVGRAGKAAAAMPAGITKAPEGPRAKPSRHSPTAQKLSTSYNEVACLSGTALTAWHGARWSRAEGAAPQPEPGAQPGPRQRPAATGYSQFPGQGEQHGHPGALPIAAWGRLSPTAGPAACLGAGRHGRAR